MLPLPQRMTMLPSIPGPQLAPLSSTMSTSKLAEGFPIDPGLGLIQMKLPTMTGDSDWPNPSLSSSPVSSLNLLKTSGLSASPAMAQRFTLDQSYLERSSWIMKRKTVGGAQKVVTRYLAITFITSAAWNLSMS